MVRKHHDRVRVLTRRGADWTKRFPRLVQAARKIKATSFVKDGIEYNEHIEGSGPTISEHVCKLGHEGIVAKRRDLPYESGRSRRWIKVKNPDSPAMKRVEDGTF